jgi:hypothetical protein
MLDLIQVRPALTADELSELKDLFFNKNTWFSKEVLENAVHDNPLKKDQRGNFVLQNHTINVKLADFIFHCQTCTDTGMRTQWYQIILGSLGGNFYFHSGTNQQNLWLGYNGSNLAKIQKGDTFNYQWSGLNFIKEEGYVCDHCRESCFDNNENLLK